jgi:hypothetical protein
MRGTPPSLARMVERAPEEMPRWRWHSIVGAVKQCEWLLPLSDAAGVFNRAVSALGAHVAVAATPDATPMSSSPESVAFHRSSCDSKSNDSYLIALTPATLPRVAAALTVMGADHAIVARFLFHYLKRRLTAATVGEDEKRVALEAMVTAMAGLRRAAVLCKGLFSVLRVATPLRLTTRFVELATTLPAAARDRRRANRARELCAPEREYGDKGDVCARCPFYILRCGVCLAVNSDVLAPKMHLRGDSLMT